MGKQAGFAESVKAINTMPFELNEPGRNEPCWCGSGKKYKKCHRMRAFEKELPHEALIHEMQAAWDHKQCLHPEAAPGVCDRIVSAHTIQRSRVLQKIVDDSNHVRSFYSLNMDFSTWKPQLNRLGWRDASTFTGFCGKHDSATFKPVEDADFTGSAEQCFLIGYRALCHEVYQKTGMVRSYPRLRELVDRGLPAKRQRTLQAFWAEQNAGAERGLMDFQNLKTQMDEQLLRRDYHGWTRVLIRLSGELCIASTGAVSVNRDLEGNTLQVLHDPDSEMQELLFGAVATSDGGAAVFTWRTGELAPTRFVESLLAKERKQLPHLLVQFLFAYIENTYFSDRWWGTLSENDRKQIETLACMGDPYYTDFSYSPSLHFVPWEVTEVVMSV